MDDAPDIPDLQMTPTTVSTGFGTGNYDPATGNAGYTLNPTLAKFRDLFYGAAGAAQPTAQQLQFGKDVSQYGQNLFGQAANLNTGQMAQDYYSQQQSALNPQRMQENVQLGDTLFKQGRTGAGVGVSGGYVNPEQFALLKAREGQNAQLMLGAEDRARSIQQQDISNAFNYSNAGSALQMQPYQNMASLFGLGTNIEGLGANTLSQVGQFGQMQQQWSQAQQQVAAAQAAAEGGGFMSGLTGALGQGIGTYFGGSLGGAVGGKIGGMIGGGGNSGGGGLFSSLFSGGGGYQMPADVSFDTYYGMGD